MSPRPQHQCLDRPAEQRQRRSHVGRQLGMIRGQRSSALSGNRVCRVRVQHLDLFQSCLEDWRQAAVSVRHQDGRLSWDSR